MVDWTQKSNADTCQPCLLSCQTEKINSEVDPVQMQWQMCGIDRWTENKEIHTLIAYFFISQSGN